MYFVNIIQSKLSFEYSSYIHTSYEKILLATPKLYAPIFIFHYFRNTLSEIGANFSEQIFDTLLKFLVNTKFLIFTKFSIVR